MALEEYARIVDAIVKGAEELRKSLERATAAHQRQAGAGRGPAGVTTAGGGTGARVLDLDQFVGAGNARQITQALQAAGLPRAARLMGRPGLAELIGFFGGRTGQAAATILRGLMGAGGGAAPAAAGAAGASGTAAGAAAAGKAAAGAAQAKAAAGAAAGGAGAAAAGGAGAAGGAAAAAGPIAAIVALVVVIGLVVRSLIRLSNSLRETADAALEAKRGLAEVHPGIAAELAKKEAAELRDKMARGAATVGMTRREVAQYERILEGTREWNIMTANLKSGWNVFTNEMKLMIARPLNKIAGTVNRIAGWESRLPKTREEALKEYPMLRGFEALRTARMYRPRVRPPSAPFNQ